MNILILGSGGREHAFAWKISQSSGCDNLFIAPGNAGTRLCGTNVNIGVADFPAIAAFCVENKIDMILVGPEDPLVKGVYDYFKENPGLAHIKVIGPSKEGAQLEGSKDFSKDFMKRHDIPTAAYETFNKSSFNEGIAFLKKLQPPYVLKADGLAAGKGVLICESYDEAEEGLSEMLQKSKFGAAGDKVVIEEFLKGIELSVFVITDGLNYKILPSAKDYKRIGDGDKGLNTGGMGAVSPVPFADDRFMEKVEKRVVIPTIEGLRKENIDYKGFIFIGLMNVGGDPFVIEYNARMGDPETEVVIPRLKNDFVEVLNAVAVSKLDRVSLEIDPRVAATIMLVSGGYPEEYEKGIKINGLESLQNELVFHAGTSIRNEDVVTSGGRVLAVTSLADSIEKAVEASYHKISKISYDKMYYRKDIGKDLMAIIND